MPDPGQPVYLVNAAGDPVRLIIQGRASYTNCAPVQQFFERHVSESKASLEIDFSGCTGMDSTFMGLLAGAAMHMRQRKPVPGEITLTHLSTRNLELIRNLGLHKLLKVEGAGSNPGFPVHKLGGEIPVESSDASNKAASQDTILRAHEDLMKADPANVAKFQDVVAFLKREAPPKP
jgi:anti-sigma B factor antagonist